MKIFIIGSVRNASPEVKQSLDDHVTNLEEEGHIVHLPHRDTKQEATGINICLQNFEAIHQSDEVHLFYCGTSQGTHFDMGVAFALDKPIRVIENEDFGPGKSYARMATEWESMGT